MSVLRWGVLSTARINRRLVAAIDASERSSIVAVASRDAGRAAAWAAKNGATRSYGSYQELLDDPEVDLVYNPLPNHLHAPWSVRAAKAGKHVLCEKPLALSPVQVDVMFRAAAKAKTVLAEAFMYRHHPRTKRVRQLISDGAVGELRSIHGTFTFPLDRGPNYRLEPDQGGGAIWDVGCYPVSFARYVVGQEPDRVEALAVEADTEVDMASSGTMRFPGGVLATFQCGFRSVFRSEMEFIGTEGSLHVPLAFQPARESPIILRTADGDHVERVAGLEPLFLGEVRDMEACLLDGAVPEISREESRGNAAALHALYDSARSGHAERPS